MIVNKEYLEKKFGKKIEDIDFNISIDSLAEDMEDEDFHIHFKDIKGLYGLRMELRDDVTPYYKLRFDNCEINNIDLEGNIEVFFEKKGKVERLEINRGYKSTITFISDCDVKIKKLIIYKNIVSLNGRGKVNIKSLTTFDGYFNDLNIRYIKIDNQNGQNKDAYSIVPQEGSFMGYKKVHLLNDDTAVAKLLILKDSLRTSHPSRRCRASKIKVLDIYDKKGVHYNKAENLFKQHGDVTYEVGKIYEVDNFDRNRYNQCTTGIHFFITEQEAMEY